MSFNFGSQDSSRFRHPQCVGTIRQKTAGFEVPLTKKLHANEELIFGRDSQRCQIFLDDPTVSNKHLRIYSIIFDQDHADEVPPLVYAEDLSRNGTYWNGTLMGVGNGGFLLSHKDVLKLSKTFEIEYHCSDSLTGKPLDREQRYAGEIIFEKKYTITDRKIGSGGFGQVYMAINNFNHRQVACKVVPLERIKEHYEACENSKFAFGRWERPISAKKVNHKTEMLKMLSWKKRGTLAHELEEKLKTYDREVEILQSLDHPNIVRLEKVFKTSEYIYMFQELVTGGDLFSFLDYKNGKLLDVEAAVVIRQVLKAVEYLHDQGIVHRDLKPDNILMTSLANGSRVILTDFGGARRIEKSTKRMTTMVGTREFIAPEVLGRNRTLPGKQGYTKAADMWSLGCVTVVLLTGGSIFRNPKTGVYCEQVASECNLDLLKNDPDWKYVGERPKDFVRGLLVLDENERMTAKQALEHSWFTNNMNKADFEDAYQRAIKNWKPRMVIGAVVEDFDINSETNNIPTKLPPKRYRSRPGVPVDPPYKPAPKNLFNKFYPPKRKSFGSVEEYVQTSQESSVDVSASSDLVQTPRAASRPPTPRPPALELPKSHKRPQSYVFKPPYPPKSAGALPVKRVMKKLPLEPLVIAKEVDCDTPLHGIEGTVMDLSPTEVPADSPVLHENGTKNQRWPFSPGAWDGDWDKSNSPARTISRELSPPKPKLYQRPPKKPTPVEKLKHQLKLTLQERSGDSPKRQKSGLFSRHDALEETTFLPLTRATLIPVTRLQSASPTKQLDEVDKLMSPPSWRRSGCAETASAQQGTPSNLVGKLTLKRVASFGLSRNESNTKKKRSVSVFGLEEEEEEEDEEEGTQTPTPCPKKRNREGSIFDFPEDEDDEEGTTVRTGSQMWPLLRDKQQADVERNEEEMVEDEGDADRDTNLDAIGQTPGADEDLDMEKLVDRLENELDKLEREHGTGSLGDREYWDEMVQLQVDEEEKRREKMEKWDEESRTMLKEGREKLVQVLEVPEGLSEEGEAWG